MRIWVQRDYKSLLHSYLCGKMPLLLRSFQLGHHLAGAPQGSACSRRQGKQTPTGNAERRPGQAAFSQGKYSDLKENIAAAVIFQIKHLSWEGLFF